MNSSDLTSTERTIVMRSIRKKQFCKVELKPNSRYKPDVKSTAKPVFDKTQAGALRHSLSCKGKMVDGTETCKFPDRFLRSCSTVPVQAPPRTNACRVNRDYLICLDGCI